MTRDGRTAFIIETRGQASETAVTVQDLPPGKHLFAVDLSDPLQAKITNALDIGGVLSTASEPVSVDVNPAGDLVAVTTKSPGEQIIVVPFRDGQLGTPLAWPLMEVDDTSAAPAAIVWSPDGRHLAVTLPERDQVVFYEFTSDSNSGTFGLRPWGEPVNVGKYPYTGVFTPDGTYFVTTNLQVGPGCGGLPRRRAAGLAQRGASVRYPRGDSARARRPGRADGEARAGRPGEPSASRPRASP